MTTYFVHDDSPLGDTLLLCDGEQLTGMYFAGQKYYPVNDSDWHAGAGLPLLEHARGELADFFAGRRHRFTVPCRAAGTPFQRRVWDELLRIPFGEVISYGALAARLGLAHHARAVGAAVGRNPLSVIIPCHRVIASTGALQGYAGGLERKRMLLDFEARETAGSRAANLSVGS